MCSKLFSNSCLRQPENVSSSAFTQIKAPKRKRVSFTINNCPQCGEPVSESHPECDHCKYCIYNDTYLGFIVSESDLPLAEAQSGEPIPVTQEQTNEQTAENVTFHDDLPQTVLSYGVPVSDDVYEHGFQQNSSLTDFLTRPILIYQREWIPGSALLTDKIYAWNLFLSNPAIERKLRNFKLLRGTLKIKILINGTPMHYGRIVVGMYPSNYTNNLSAFADPSQITNAQNYLLGAGTPLPQLPLAPMHTSRPKVFLNPSKNIPVEIHWPFFSASSWIEANNQNDYNRMGYLEFWELNPLRHVTEVTGTFAHVEITFFAWMEDVELCGITPEFTAQSMSVTKKKVNKSKRNTGKSIPKQTGSDEFAGDGVISAPASAVAGIAKRLCDVPVIGKFAKATYIGANSVSQIASLFGFSYPTIIEKPMPVYQIQSGRLPHVDGADPVVKLSLDPKNELTIDPSTVGIPNNDELAFSYIAQREALFGIFVWESADPADSMVASWLVHPLVSPIYADPTNTEIYQTFTNVGHIAYPFDFWTGSLIFRIQVVCSQFHRGRLAVVYSPDVDGSLASPNYAENYVHVIDISSETDVSFQVNWGQITDWARVYRQNLGNITTDAYQSSALQFNSALQPFCNGRLGLVVLNTLTAPNAQGSDYDVQINCYISAGPDFRVASPGSPFGNMAVTIDGYTEFPAQSMTAAYGKTDEEDDPNQSTDYIINGGTPMDTNMMLVYHGEDVRSIRQMLKRYNYYFSYLLNYTLGGSRLHHPFFPTAPKTTSARVGTMLNLQTLTAVNAVNLTYFRYYSRGFIGFRGSMKYKVFWSNDHNLAQCLIVRNPDNIDNINEAGFDVTQVTTDAINQRNKSDLGGLYTLAGGQLGTGLGSQNVHSVEIPMYSAVRYFDINDTTATNSFSPFSPFRNNNFNINFWMGNTNANVAPPMVYTACGEDATFFFYVGVPPLVSTAGE